MRRSEEKERRRARALGPVLLLAFLCAWAWAGLYAGMASGQEGAIEFQCEPGPNGPVVVVADAERGTDGKAGCTNSQLFMIGDRIDMRTAGADELIRLPGVGGATVRIIISEREERGGFESIEDVLSIPGLSENARRSLARWARVNQREVY